METGAIVKAEGSWTKRGRFVRGSFVADPAGHPVSSVEYDMGEGAPVYFDTGAEYGREG
jgi:hypothetical protein